MCEETTTKGEQITFLSFFFHRHFIHSSGTGSYFGHVRCGCCRNVTLALVFVIGTAKVAENGFLPKRDKKKKKCFSLCKGALKKLLSPKTDIIPIKS